VNRGFFTNGYHRVFYANNHHRNSLTTLQAYNAVNVPDWTVPTPPPDQLADCGGIYNIGRSPGTAIHHNIVYNTNSTSVLAEALYLDEGSSNVAVHNNVIVGTALGGLFQHIGMCSFWMIFLWTIGFVPEAWMRKHVSVTREYPQSNCCCVFMTSVHCRHGQHHHQQHHCRCGCRHTNIPRPGVRAPVLKLTVLLEECCLDSRCYWG
jgi:hypothetical protein